MTVNLSAEGEVKTVTRGELLASLEQSMSTSSNDSLRISRELVHEDAATNCPLIDDGQTMSENFLFVRVHSSILQ